MTKRSKLLEIIQAGEDLGLIAPLEITRDLMKEDAQAILNALKLKIKLKPSDLPLVKLLTPGAMPPPLKPGLIPVSDIDGVKWQDIASRTVYMGMGGGGTTTAMGALQILALLLTVDGAGSLLDADLLDGLEAAAFALTGHNHAGVYEPADATILKSGNADWIDLTDGGATALHSHAAAVPNGTVQYQVLTTGPNPFAAAWSDFLVRGTTGGVTNLAVTNTKTLTLTAADDRNITFPITGTAAIGAGTLTAATANDVTVNAHTHAITGFEPTDATIVRTGDSDWIDLTDAGATTLHSHAPDHAAVSLDANADTLLALAGQALGLDTQAAKTVFAGPTSGAAAVPTFRALAAADIPSISADGTYLISGGGVTWQSGYTYTVSAGTGYINGVLYGWAQQDIVLDAADTDNDRIDIVAVDNTLTVVKITGTPAADPSEPVVDPSTQLELAFVLVTADSSQPAGITSELIYAENVGSGGAPAEWDWSTSGVGFNVNSATNPRTGTKDIEGTNVAANAYALAQRGSGTINPANFTQLVLYIRFKASWNASRYLQIQLQNAGVKKGNALRISPGQFGLDGTNTTTYQAVIIPTLQFAVPTGTLINQVRIIDVGGAIGFYIDDISITTGGAGGTIVTGMTQEEADARYSQLGHVHDAAAVTYTPAASTDWNSDTDPGNTDDALDQLAARIKGIIWPVTKTVSNPQAVYTQRAQVVLFRAPAALTITHIHIHGSDTSPTAEMAGDLKWADDVNTGGFANAAVIDVCDTTNGVVTIDAGFDDATVASGKYIYFQMDASPHADWKDFYIEFYYTLD